MGQNQTKNTVLLSVFIILYFNILALQYTSHYGTSWV